MDRHGQWRRSELMSALGALGFALACGLACGLAVMGVFALIFAL